MSKRPSDTSVEQAITAVIAELPHLLPLTTFQKLAGGYANLVYEINGNYILRVFFRRGWEANYEAERAALEMVASIPHVPHVLAAGILPLEWSCPFLLLNKCTGINAFGAWLDASHSDRQLWAEQIAVVLRQAHAVPLPQYGLLVDKNHASPIPSTSSSKSVFPSWQQLHDTKMAGLLASARSKPLTDEASHLVDEAEIYYSSHRAALVYQAGPCLVHGDVRLHNVIVDDIVDGSIGAVVTGLIDWEWAHGGEPDEDLINVIRFSLFPNHEASGVDAARTKRNAYAPLFEMLLCAYPELMTIPEIAARLTIYLVESDLGQMQMNSDFLQRDAEGRLNGWLRQSLVEHSMANVLSARAV